MTHVPVTRTVAPWAINAAIGAIACRLHSRCVSFLEACFGLVGTVGASWLACQCHGIDPLVQVKDVLTRLPAMTNHDDSAALMSAKWKQPTADKAAESKSR
jgi:hypothetical protein